MMEGLCCASLHSWAHPVRHRECKSWPLYPCPRNTLTHRIAIHVKRCGDFPLSSCLYLSFSISLISQEYHLTFIHKSQQPTTQSRHMTRPRISNRRKTKHRRAAHVSAASCQLEKKRLACLTALPPRTSRRLSRDYCCILLMCHRYT